MHQVCSGQGVVVKDEGVVMEDTMHSCFTALSIILM